MWQRGVACLLLLVLPGLTLAQEGPDRLLPSNTQIFFRWDGFDAHRAAYEKTAVGKMMQGDTGKFLDALWVWLVEAAEAGAAQADPQAAAFLKDGVAALSSVVKNGVAISVAAKGVAPPQAQLTVVFPKSGAAMIPLVTKLATMSGAPLGEAKVGNRVVNHVNIPPFVNLGWWMDGADAVFMVGTDDPAGYAKMIDDKETGLAQHPLYKQVASFKEFTVWGRGYLDIAALAKMGSEVSPEVARLIDDLGIKGIKSVTFVSGFDGVSERGITEMDVPGPRKGLLALAGTKKISLANLPPMPDDLTGFAASNFNMGKVYDTGIQVVEAVVRLFAPDQADNIKEGVNQVEGLIGVKLGEDFFGQFDDVFVRYSSASEGPLGLGGVYLFKVKNEQKLQAAVEKLFGAIPQLPGLPVEIKKSKYQGVDINILNINSPGQFTALSFATYKGWFVVGSYPQSVYGYILRAKGELPAWKADAKLTEALAAFPKEFTGISVTDPRPTVRTVFSLLPPVITFANGFTQFVPGLRPFDVSLIPHAQEATRHLFPNITVTTDDGKKIRAETRASLAVPF